jgi:flagellar motor switch protein FliN/FliY
MNQTDHSPLPDLNSVAENTMQDAGREGSQSSAPVLEADLDPVLDVPITITAILGRTHLAIADVLRLNEGSIIELDKAIGEPIDIYINNRLIARGEVTLVDDNLAITLSEIVSATA